MRSSSLILYRVETNEKVSIYNFSYDLSCLFWEVRSKYDNTINSNSIVNIDELQKYNYITILEEYFLFLFCLLHFVFSYFQRVFLYCILFNVVIIVIAVGRRKSPRGYCRASYACQSRYSSQSVKSENRS